MKGHENGEGKLRVKIKVKFHFPNEKNFYEIFVRRCVMNKGKDIEDFSVHTDPITLYFDFAVASTDENVYERVRHRVKEGLDSIGCQILQIENGS